MKSCTTATTSTQLVKESEKPHGPHPGTVESTLNETSTDELVVMCDTFRPLFPTKAAMDIDDDTYPQSWADWKPIPIENLTIPSDS